MKTLALLSLLVAPFVVGCSGSSSSSDSSSLHSANVPTNQMKASFSVQSGDSTVKVFAAVFSKDAKGATRVITLDQGDSFVVTVAGSAPVTLTMAPSDDDGHYSTTLPLATTAEDLTIALLRGSGQVSAPNSFVHLAAPFTMTSSSSDTVKKGSSIPFNLDPVPASQASLKFEVFGPCLADTGNDNLATPAIDGEGNGAVDTSKFNLKDFSSCELQLYIDALSVGTLDSAFAGGLTGLDQDLESEQRRAIVRTLTP
ncbi:MAG: hypothetical protein ABI551_25030 [Polyangiaceae bacterium]